MVPFLQSRPTRPSVNPSHPSSKGARFFAEVPGCKMELRSKGGEQRRLCWPSSGDWDLSRCLEIPLQVPRTSGRTWVCQPGMVCGGQERAGTRLGTLSSPHTFLPPSFRLGNNHRVQMHLLKLALRGLTLATSPFASWDFCLWTCWKSERQHEEQECAFHMLMEQHGTQSSRQSRCGSIL